MYVFNLSLLTCSKWQYSKLLSQVFLQHERTTLHKRQCRQVVPKGQKPFQLPAAPDLADDAIWTRIHCAWWLAKEDVAICKFSSYLEATLIDIRASASNDLQRRKILIGSRGAHRQTLSKGTTASYSIVFLF